MRHDRGTRHDPRLCRRWRYTEAKYHADSILVTEDEDHHRLGREVHEQLRAIEAKILAAKPAGAGDAAEILEVVLTLVGEDSAVDDRDTRLLRQAIKALAFSDERWGGKSAA